MTTEADAIPYEAARLRGERLLVLAPHPDDEAIGPGGLVAQHLRERRPVRVVVATDGAQAGDGARREAESLAGLNLLGDGAQVTFLRFPDRALADAGDALRAALRTEISGFRPDLVLVPSPVEIHPDHVALATAFCELVQNDESLFADLALARVAFYEVSQPLRPNALVDITDAAEAKYAAVAAHASQLAFRDYPSYARGLNAYRAMTLTPEARYAEAYFVIDLPKLRTTPVSELQRRMGDARTAEVVRETVPISVLVRTKDRPQLLREAIDSIRANGYPAEIVVVNDGGARLELEGVTLVEHETTRGRSAAMNSAARTATSKYLAFLDDDDLYHPEHLATLARAAASMPGIAWYTEAVSAFYRPGESGALEPYSELRLFGGDFDRDLLLLDNYIPLPTLLLPRDAFLDLGGFDTAFDLFEDWDFLIRLSARGDFTHVPRVTCRIRHIEGGGSITIANPEGSPRFREAKLQVWTKHAARIDNDTIANAFERQKRRLSAAMADAVEAKGLRHHYDITVARLEREKQQLIGEIGALHETLNTRNTEVTALQAVAERLRGADAEWRMENERKAVRIAGLEEQNQQLEKIAAEGQTSVAALYAEVQRLQSLLDTIFQSRTWKLHTMVEKMKGRG